MNDKKFNWPKVKWFCEDNKAALRMLVSIIKQSTVYKNPQTTGDGFLVEAVLWLEDHNLRTDKPTDETHENQNLL